MKSALITGISGQDGSYLAEYLLQLGYRVYGIVHREPNSMRWIAPFSDRLELLYGDLRDNESLEVAFQKARPDEVYNLAGQVFAPTSWQCPAETFDINVGGLARLLAIVERVKSDARVYQASSSEMYGDQHGACDERTPFRPTSPYGTSKMAAHHLAHVYRQRGVFVVGGILFNHESPRRGAEMVTRKITRAAANWVSGDTEKLKLGNLQARRDWGFAGDYIRAMHAMLQRPEPTDYVIGSGESHSVAEFLSRVLAEIGALMPGVDTEQWAEERVEIDPLLLRTGEIRCLLANPARAMRELGWQPEVNFNGLVRMMVRADVEALGKAVTRRYSRRWKLMAAAGHAAAIPADGRSAV